MGEVCNVDYGLMGYPLFLGRGAAEACRFGSGGSYACRGFLVVQGRISGTKVAAGLVALALAVTLAS